MMGRRTSSPALESITRNPRCRDRRIGWSDARKSGTRHPVVVNAPTSSSGPLRHPRGRQGARPRRAALAPESPGRAARPLHPNRPCIPTGQGPDDREDRDGDRPVLIETSARTTRLAGGSCRAAGSASAGP